MTNDPERRRLDALSDARREGDAPAEPLNEHELPRLGGSLALPSKRLALPVRRQTVHGIRYVDGQPTIIFDTLCVKQRRPVLACDEFHRVFREVAAKATAWLMGRYVIMPDHIHFFAGDVGGDVPYENWVTYLKSQLTRRMGASPSRRCGGSAGASPSRR